MVKSVMDKRSGRRVALFAHLFKKAFLTETCS